MLIRKGNRWQLHPHKVRYTNSLSDSESNVTVWVNPSKDWWTETEKLHEHITVHEFIEEELSEEQLNRFEEIKDMPEDFMDIYIDYILTGDTSNDVELPTNHPFNIIRLKNENKELKGSLDDAIMELSTAIVMQGQGGA